MKMRAPVSNGGGAPHNHIKMGGSVDIKRSDGRIHSAVVSNINLETSIITVEWFERGETKGKDVELDAILNLNQDLVIAKCENSPQSGGPPPQPITSNKISSVSGNSLSQQSGGQSQSKGPPVSTAVPTKLQKYIPRPTNVNNNWTNNNKSNSNPSTDQNSDQSHITNNNNNNSQSNMVSRQNTVGGGGGGATTRAHTRKTIVASHPPHAAPPPAAAATAPPTSSAAVQSIDEEEDFLNDHHMGDEGDLDDLGDGVAPMMTGHSGNVLQPPALTNLQQQQGSEYRRRSNVVKEVERLKKNRETRRAKQAETLLEKEAAKTMDANSPNWDFLCMIRDYQDQLDYHPLTDSSEGQGAAGPSNHRITVSVRKRPVSNKEMKKREIDVITCPNKDQVIVHEPKTKVDLTKYLDNQHFRYDFAFDETSSNELVYKYTAKPLVLNIFEGGMATCFAYGQTGSGKTHTMGGEFHGKNQDSKNGIYAMATRDVFKLLSSPKYKSLKLQPSCSYFEIYGGKVFDLLSGKSKLRVLEDGKQQVVIVGLTEKVVESVDDVLKLITHGNSIRTSGQTSANINSSRSHAVFQIILRTYGNLPPSHKMRGGPPPPSSLYGKLSLIDLAGNERGADTCSANRQTRMEGAEINKSLLALKECIRALGRKGGHLPFRASKLTQVLRDSFIGEKSKTCMIAMVSPIMSSCEHTLNTLRYADRVKELGAADPLTKGGGGGSSSNNVQGVRCGGGGGGDDDELHEYGEDGDYDDLEGGILSPEDSDLAQLRSMNEGELSADWYNFQEAISHLQLMEEDLVECHHSVIKHVQEWTQQDSKLLAITNQVDYDQDAYCQELEEGVDRKIEILKELQTKARAFRQILSEEESKSRALTQQQQQQPYRGGGVQQGKKK